MISIRLLSNVIVQVGLVALAACGGGGGGAGTSSAAVNTITAPGIPVIESVSAGNAQATVTFTAPSLNGGAEVTSYTVTSTPGGFGASGPASPLTVTGLSNGVAYTFTVRASNSAGTGAPSVPSDSVTPATVPGAPIIGSATAGSRQATVTFTPPSSDGGAAITAYTVISTPGGFSASGPASPLTVMGLTNGVSYSFMVSATNSAGTGPVSAPSNTMISGAPVVTVLASSTKVLTFNWAVIAGSTHYKLLKNPDGLSGYTQVGADIPHTVTTVTDYIGVHLNDWINASYIVQACDLAGCTSSRAVLTTTAMISTIGIFKSSNPDEGDGFGISMSLASDGKTLAVGAYGEDSNSTGINSIPNNAGHNSGAVYVYARSGNLWSQQAYVKASNTGAADWFGQSVSLSADGSTLAVGAREEDSSSTGINSVPDEGAADAGAVYVYSRSGSVWSQEAYIKASNTGAGDWFGYSVSLSGDGTLLAVGARQEDSSTTGINSTPDEDSINSGAVYVYSRSGVTWSEQAYIKASNTGGHDDFGQSLSLSGDGITLAVGSRQDSSLDAGAAYVYSRSGSTWSQQAYIKASNFDSNDQFGIAIALSANGSTLAVGSWLEDSSTTGINSTANESSNNSGAVYVFTRSGSTWSQQAYIKASNTGPNDLFGQALSLSADGTILAVGAEFEDSNATGINRPSNESSIDSGAVYVYSRNGNIWSQKSYIKASNTGGNDLFGESVTLSGDGSTLAVGAIQEDSRSAGIFNGPPPSGFDALDSGAVYVY